MTVPEIIVAGGVRYLQLGGCVALLFALFGASRLEPSARAASLGFRLTIVPGAMLLWPLIVLRALRGGVAARRVHSAAEEGGT